MKTKIIFILLNFVVINAFCQNTMVVQKYDGTKISYGFLQKPKVTYSEEVLTVSTLTTTVEFPIADVRNISFEDNPELTDLMYLQYVDAEVYIYDISGKLVGVEKKNSDININIANLVSGTYIIKTGNTSYKILKQ